MRPQHLALIMSGGVTCVMVGLLLGIVAAGGHVSHVLDVIHDPPSPTTATLPSTSTLPASQPTPSAVPAVAVARHHHHHRRPPGPPPPGREHDEHHHKHDHHREGHDGSGGDQES